MCKCQFVLILLSVASLTKHVCGVDYGDAYSVAEELSIGRVGGRRFVRDQALFVVTCAGRFARVFFPICSWIFVSLAWSGVTCVMFGSALRCRFFGIRELRRAAHARARRPWHTDMACRTQTEGQADRDTRAQNTETHQEQGVGRRAHVRNAEAVEPLA